MNATLRPSERAGTERLLDLGRGIVARARRGEQVEAYVLRSRDTDVRVLRGDVESLSVAQVEGVGVRVIVGGRQGYAWAGSLDPSNLEAVLEDARDNAVFATPEDWRVLPDPSDHAAVGPAALDLWCDDLAAAPTDDKVDLALRLEQIACSLHPRVRGVEAASYGDAVIQAAIVSSLGIEVSTARTVCSCAVSVLAGEGDGTQTGSGFSFGRRIFDLDVEHAARDAVDRAVRLLGARPLRSQRLPVILDPVVTLSVLGVVGAALNGEAVVKGRSMFADRAGETVAAPHITLLDEPTNAAAYGAAEYDAEGVPTRTAPLIVDGVLAGFLHNTATARRAGTLSTGSAVRGGFRSAPSVGVRALRLQPGQRTPAEIIADTPHALYVQSASGLHSGTNPASGDFSVGAEGLIVRDGAFAEPVRGVTIASTLPRMLLEVAEVGSDLTWLPGGGAGLTVVIGEMSVSGT